MSGDNSILNSHQAGFTAIIAQLRQLVLTYDFHTARALESHLALSRKEVIDLFTYGVSWPERIREKLFDPSICVIERGWILRAELGKVGPEAIIDAMFDA